MKRWVAAIAVAVAILSATGLAVLLRGTQPMAQPGAEDTMGVVHDPDAVTHMKEALRSNGAKETAFAGDNWRGSGCQQHMYFVQPVGGAPFFFTRDILTGDLEIMTAEKVEEELHHYISYRGAIDGSRIQFDDENVYYWLGPAPDEKLPVDVYVRFARTACTLSVDQIWYRGLKDSKYVPTNIPLIP